MGLDIKFNLVEAMVAGMTIHAKQTGSSSAIANAELAVAEDPCDQNQEYLSWLEEVCVYADIPHYPNSFVLEVIDTKAYVRANKWGSLYEPLTTFLRDNNIIWDEL
jgi:hypothetical protein